MINFGVVAKHQEIKKQIYNVRMENPVNVIFEVKQKHLTNKTKCFHLEFFFIHFIYLSLTLNLFIKKKFYTLFHNYFIKLFLINTKF